MTDRSAFDIVDGNVGVHSARSIRRSSVGLGARIDYVRNELELRRKVHSVDMQMHADVL